MKVETKEEIIFLEANQIIRVEKDNNLYLLYLNNHRKLSTRIPIDEIEKQLHNESFLRIQQNQWVNVDYISRIELNTPSFIELSAGDRLEIEPNFQFLISNYFTRNPL